MEPNQTPQIRTNYYITHQNGRTTFTCIHKNSTFSRSIPSTAAPEAMENTMRDLFRTVAVYSHFGLDYFDSHGLLLLDKFKEDHPEFDGNRAIKDLNFHQIGSYKKDPKNKRMSFAKTHARN